MTSPVYVVGVGAVSAWGTGPEAYRSTFPGGARRIGIVRHPRFEARGLAEPFFAPAASIPYGADRATELLSFALAECAHELDRSRPSWRGERVGLVVGTSSGAMDEFEALVEGRPVAVENVSYGAPLVEAIRRTGITFSPASLVLGACASSSFALGVARAWLRDRRCDLVLAGGFDGESFFVAAGFSALHALDPSGSPKPFEAERRGMILGEGAAVVALAREAWPGALGAVIGFGATLDASSLVAPDPDGRGLVAAATTALAGQTAGMVSAHATATEKNDDAEARALSTLGLEEAPTHAMKPEIGHTLGASGVLEALALLEAMERTSTPVGLKLSAAFGGANGALALGRASVRSTKDGRPQPRETWVAERVHIASIPEAAELRRREVLRGLSDVRLDRADAIVRLGLDAVATLAERVGGDGLRGAAIVVGHGLATFETNVAFHRSVLARGSRGAEPRKFPYTSPNAVVGECAAALGLSGVGYAVGLAGGIEALLHGASLIREHLAERVVVLGIDAEGEEASVLGLPVSPYPEVGAVALLLTAGGEVRRPGSLRIDETVVTADPSAARFVPRGLGHGPLLPLFRGGADPAGIRLETAGIVAKVHFSV